MARTLVTASAIYTGDPPRPGPTSMIVEDARLAWLGPRSEAPRPVPRQRIDLGEAVVIPGFIDSHQHLFGMLWLTNWIDCRERRTPEAAVALLKERAGSAPEGTWIAGWGYDAMHAERGRRVNRTMLDEVSLARPVMLVESSFHQGAANSVALAAVGFGRTTPRRFGGELERDRRGEPTGMAWERAFSVLDRAARRAEERALGPVAVDRVREICRTHLAQGITHAAEALAGPADIEVLRAAALPVGVTAMPSSARGSFATPWDALDGPRTGEGDAGLAIGHLKLFADGGERCALSLPLPTTMLQTATLVWRAARRRDTAGFRLLAGSRANLQGGRLVSGTLHYPPGRMADVIAEALARGFSVAVHALGNLAVRVAVDAFEEARCRTGVDIAGCRIEHAMFADPGDLERAASLGLILSMQPGHAVHYAPAMRAVGVDRALDPVPLRRALDSGCRLAISSDGPTSPGTALDNMRAAVDRLVADGTTFRPDLAITPQEALRAATMGGAEACRVADTKGSLEPGKRADFGVLSGDPFDPDTRVLATWVAGQKVYP